MENEKETPIDIRQAVMGVFPDASPTEFVDLLWCCTAFPFSKDPSLIEFQLKEAKEKGGGTVSGAMSWAHQDLDERMDTFQATRCQALWNEMKSTLSEVLGMLDCLQKDIPQLPLKVAGSTTVGNHRADIVGVLMRVKEYENVYMYKDHGCGEVWQ